MNFIRVLSLFALSIMLYGCTGGISCGSGCDGTYVYPQSTLPNGVQQVDDGTRMRMTQAGLDFLRENIKDILIGALGAQTGDPDTIAIELPPTEVIGGVTLGEGPNEVYPTTVLIEGAELENRLNMAFVEAGDTVFLDGNAVTINQDGILLDAVGIPVGLDARLFTEVDYSFGLTAPATAACDVDGTNPDFCPGGSECGILTDLSIGILVFPDVGTGVQCDIPGTECLLMNVDVVHVDLGDVGANSIDISVPPFDSNNCAGSNPPDLCSPECSDTVLVFDDGGAAECTFICSVTNFGIDLVLGIVGFIEPLLQDFLDEIFEAAIRNALDDFDGAPIGVNTRVALSELGGGVFSPSTLDLGVGIQPTGNAFDVNCPAGVNCSETTGMDIILKSGFESAPDLAMETANPHPCVNPISGADFIELYGGIDFEVPPGAPLDGIYDGEVYHLGASLAESAVNQVFFALYNTGALCLELSSDGVHALTGGAFPLSAGTLDLLTEGKLRQFTSASSPAIVNVVPSQPPIVRMGAGTEEDPHLIIEWPAVEVSFYVLMYERFSRVFTVATDIRAGLNVYNDPETTTLQISIVDGPTVDNFQPLYNELLPGVDFGEILGSLVGLVFDAALGNGLEFDIDVASTLSDALGVPLYVDFQGLETTPVSDPAFLNVYLSLTNTPPPQPALIAPLPLMLAQEPGLYRPRPHATLEGRAAPAPTGAVRVVGHLGGLGEDVEYFARVDSLGLWHGPLRPDSDGVVTIKDGKLALLGAHTIALKGRMVGVPASLEAVPSTLVVHVDPEAPRAHLDVTDTAIVASAEDLVTQAGDFTFAWRLDDGRGDAAFGAFGPGAILSMAELDGIAKVSVRARDAAGNISTPVTVDLDALAASPALRDTEWATARRVDALEEAAGGCAQTAGDRSLVAFAALLAAFGIRRRRR